jgi:hypothetical protein
MALSFERMPNYALDNADIVREAMLRQLSKWQVRRTGSDTSWQDLLWVNVLRQLSVAADLQIGLRVVGKSDSCEPLDGVTAQALQLTQERIGFLVQCALCSAPGFRKTLWTAHARILARSTTESNPK